MRRRSSAPTTRTFSRTRVPRRTSRSISRSSSPGETILAMRLDQGGHLTHGSPVSITGKIYRFVSYGVTPARHDGSGERIDFDQFADLARGERPRLIVAGTTAYTQDHRSRCPSARSRTRSGRCSCSTPRTCGPHRRRRAPESRRGRRRRHLHHPQDSSWAPRRRHPLRGRAREGDRLRSLPRAAGRPTRTRHRRESCRLRRGATPEFKQYAAERRGQRRGARRSAVERRIPPRRWRDREPPGDPRSAQPSTPNSPARRPGGP